MGNLDESPTPLSASFLWYARWWPHERQVTEHYTDISTNAASSAVELLEKIRPQPQFVDEFVDLTARLEAKSLQ